MNRNLWNEKAGRNSTVSAPAIGWDAVALYVREVAKAARRQLAKLAIARELSALDDRSLADIGINRAQIAYVADKAAGETAPGADFGALVQHAIVVPFKLWREKARATRELSQLSDRELLDIGLTRADIPAVIAQMSEKYVVSAPAQTREMAASAKVAAPARSVQEVGVIRGDVERLAEAVANRNLPKGARPSAA